MDLIRVKNVEKKYKNGVTAIYDLNLAIEKGSFVFVIGGSGSGKSTLIKMLYREEKPTKGQVIVGGLDVAKLRNSKVYKLRRKLGIVFQDYRLLPKLTVYENVAFALECIGEKKDIIRKKVLKALEDVGLKNKVHNYPDQLSGGEQQVRLSAQRHYRPLLYIQSKRRYGYRRQDRYRYTQLVGYTWLLCPFELRLQEPLPP